MYPHLSCGYILDFSTWQMWEILKLLYTWRNFKLIQNRDVFCDLRFFVAPLFCRDLRAFAWRKISPKFYMWRQNDKYQVCWKKNPRLCHFKFFDHDTKDLNGLKRSVVVWDTCKRLWLWEGTPAGFILSSPHKKVSFQDCAKWFWLVYDGGRCRWFSGFEKGPPSKLPIMASGQ